MAGKPSKPLELGLLEDTEGEMPDDDAGSRSRGLTVIG